MPLTPQEHARLNGLLTPSQRSDLVGRLRRKYARDGIARRQLDMYDADSAYTRRLRRLRDRLRGR